MNLHLRPVPRRYSSALDAKYADTHRRLRQEIEEERLSAEIADRHNERVRRNHQFRQQGGE